MIILVTAGSEASHPAKQLKLPIVVWNKNYKLNAQNTVVNQKQTFFFSFNF